ncbi:MAG: DoxX family protein [Hymenobacteraceae bacterium]|nr:DoxX family protein [Hymenobacteraceae bacterium]
MYLRLLSRFFWILVGSVFILSGLIKLNDPVGTAIKLEEYFEVFAHDFGVFFLSFRSASRFLSITLSAAEVTLGAALLLRYQLRITLWLLLGLTVFFGLLTFYSAAFNKVTDCGCFGDAIKLTPWMSFWKDLVLLGGVVFLLRTHERWLKPYNRRPLIGTVLVTSAAGVAVGIGVWALGHLPIVDLLPYGPGKDIGQQMKPAEAPRYRYTFTKPDGSTVESEQYLMDSTLKYKAMEVLNPAESKPKITDLRVWNAQTDNYEQELLRGNKLVLVIQGFEKLDRDRMPSIAELMRQAAASSRHIEPVILTAASQADFEVFRHEKKLTSPYYFADATVLKTMIRSNPGLLLLQNGRVINKWHYHDLPSLRGVEKGLEK